MSVTTVKITDKTKSSLDELNSGSETYDEVISKLIENSRKKDLKERMVKGYKSIGKEELELLKEWDFASAEVK